MPTIIECPACTTRYKMNKPIPEGGRYVKCARCGHQWRLVPEGSEASEHDTREDHGNSMAMAQSTPGVTAAHHTGFSGGDDTESEHQGWQEHEEEHATSVDGAGEGGVANPAWSAGDDSDHDHAALKDAWNDFESQNPENSANGVNGADADDDWAERIKRSSWSTEDRAADQDDGAADQTVQQDNTHAAVGLNDPEIEIRAALNNALHHPDEVATTAEPANADPFQDFWQGFASGDGDDDEEGRGLDAKRADAIAAQIENVRRSSVLYDPSALRDGFAGDEDSTADAAMQSDIAAAFKADALQKRTPTRPEYRHDESLTDYDAHNGEGTEGEFGAEYMHDDAAELQAQLEGFGQMPYEEPRRGGLALVAAWAVFLSITSGIVLAFVNFRDDMMAALPGTTQLYSTLGFDIADRRIDFGNVGYRWTLASGKPVIEVKGQIINMTDHEVDVPRVLITVRDAQTSDGIKAMETVRTEPLAARETAPFTLEFMSPSKTVSQIEIEFDSAR